MLKIKLVSDLHLEFAEVDIDNGDGCDVLILGGDILIASDLVRGSESPRTAWAERYRRFIARCADSHKHVLAIAGNHEFYGGKWHDSLNILRREYEVHPNVQFLEDSTCVIDGVRFIGATLWTDLNRGDPSVAYAVANAMNDYHVVTYDGSGYRKLRTSDTLQRHRTSLQYIRDVLRANPDQPTVVVGHHLPTHQSVSQQYRGRNDPLNYAYYSSLENTILDNPQIVLWTCGHTHHRHRYYVGNTLVAAAPRGYKGREPQADAFLPGVVDLGNMPAVDAVAADYDWKVG